MLHINEVRQNWSEKSPLLLIRWFSNHIIARILAKITDFLATMDNEKILKINNTLLKINAFKSSLGSTSYSDDWTIWLGDDSEFFKNNKKEISETIDSPKSLVFSLKRLNYTARKEIQNWILKILNQFLL